jgi:hypothetical protein
MHSFLVVIHVASMIISLGLMAGAILLGFMGKNSAARVSTIGIVATAIGGMSGTVLLFFAPLPIQCIELTFYIAAMVSLYIFGFARGSAEAARLIRH